MSTESNNTPVDPRVQIELEKLNTATDNINKYEVELDEAKCEFKRILAESVVRIKQSAHKLGNSIEAAKPYYESRIYAAQLAKETQTAAANYEKAKSIHAAAKEMVYLAEQGLGEKSTLDTACQEMLSHAASKVNQSQLEVTDARNSLKMCQLKLEVANNRVGKLQGQLRQAIKASSFNIRRNLLLINLLAYQHDLNHLPYYETRANYNGILKSQKEKINSLENKVAEAKMTYNEALKNLEQISEEIHRQRQQQQQNLLNYETMMKQVEDTASNYTSSSGDMGTFQQFSCDIDTSDEYLEMPDKLSTNSSPIRQRHLDEHECPHLLQDFESVLTFPQKIAGGMHKSASTSNTSDNLFAQAQLHGPYDVKCCSSIGSGQNLNTDNSSSTGKGGGGSSSGGGGGGRLGSHSMGGDNDDHDIEQWTEIRLSHSESTSSSYSNQSLLHDHAADDAQSHHSSSSSSDEPKRKVTCTTIFQEDQLNRKQSLTQWLSRSNSLKVGGRRQSLDLLIDASDKVKDVFSFGFQKVGRSLERRNSESEMNNECSGNGTNSTASGTGSVLGGGGSHTSSTSNTTSAGDFFLFSRSEPKELLSDEQVENLLLNHTVDENGTIIVEELKSPLQQPSGNKYGIPSLLV
ncbi:uncharacterized protein LOC142229390 isoform X2 [Haematobia irritans]|uniref:uncharacterized protein LOC142229390 isoform X2 n=1 Tax=Haematobia irritans TaxID=7368 RepID=UPI003F4FA631